MRVCGGGSGVPLPPTRATSAPCANAGTRQSSRHHRHPAAIAGTRRSFCHHRHDTPSAAASFSRLHRHPERRITATAHVGGAPIPSSHATSASCAITATTVPLPRQPRPPPRANTGATPAPAPALLPFTLPPQPALTLPPHAGTPRAAPPPCRGLGAGAARQRAGVSRRVVPRRCLNALPSGFCLGFLPQRSSHTPGEVEPPPPSCAVHHPREPRGGDTAQDSLPTRVPSEW